MTSSAALEGYGRGFGAVALRGSLRAEVESEIRDAIRFHIDGLKADSAAVPMPTSIAEYVET
jgi:predicted RNase H-like HicB family nuclease